MCFMNYVFVAHGIPDYFPKNIMTSLILALLRILLLLRIMNKGKNQFRIKALEAIFTQNYLQFCQDKIHLQFRKTKL